MCARGCGKPLCGRMSGENCLCSETLMHLYNICVHARVNVEECVCACDREGEGVGVGGCGRLCACAGGWVGKISCVLVRKIACMLFMNVDLCALTHLFDMCVHVWVDVKDCMYLCVHAIISLTCSHIL